MPETPSYTEGEILKTKSEGFQEDHMGWFQKEGLFFLPGNLQCKLFNSLHHSFRGEGPPKITKKVLQSNRLQTAIRQVVSSCSIFQLNNPQGARRPQLTQPVQWHVTYPGEDCQTNFTQMPVSQEYKYLLVMTDTFTGWIGGFLTRTEKAEEVVKNCSMKSFQDLVFPGHYKVTMGHHLLLQSPKGSLKHWALLTNCIVPVGLSLQEK